MLKTIEAVFDGTSFVPTTPVALPAGTKVVLSLPDVASVGPKPAPLTEQQRAEWERLSRLWAEAESPFESVEEAMAHSRGRPWPEDGP